eukprot:Phypoly_transcript_18731.p1 GENE.Phypoly_transcript_18731~~Phypoly_transcript_18731.p1  ORF type:complete len:228 (+),score=33.81 Phypoly_transcript_18731:46-684(+)
MGHEIRALEVQKAALINSIRFLVGQEAQLQEKIAWAEREVARLENNNEAQIQDLQQQNEVRSGRECSSEGPPAKIDLKNAHQGLADILESPTTIHLFSIVEGLSDKEAQSIQFDKAAFLQELRENVRRTISQFVSSSLGQLLKKMEKITADLAKQIGENETTFEMVQSTQVPQTIKAKMLAEISERISTLRDEQAVWALILARSSLLGKKTT